MSTVIFENTDHVAERIHELRRRLGLPSEVLQQLRDAHALNEEQTAIVSEIDGLEWLLADTDDRTVPARPRIFRVTGGSSWCLHR